MNTTDCEKIVCKFAKELQFEAKKFDEGFVEQSKEDVVLLTLGEGGGGDGEARRDKVDDDDTFMTTKEDLETKAQQTQLAGDTLKIVESSSCCENSKGKEDETALEDFANFSEMVTHCELPKSTDLSTTVVLSPPPPPQPPAPPQQQTETNDNQTLDGSLEFSPGDFDDSLQPLSERWSPLGANYDDAVTPSSELLSPESELELLSQSDVSQEKQDFSHNGDDPAEVARLKTLEEEQEMLTSSLMALTSHFAHVQLRVRQIVEAPPHERDQLLKDLEEFAFQGIPDQSNISSLSRTASRCGSSLRNHTEDGQVDKRQFELIEQLKTQLTELEKIAYESGAPVLPQHILLEKQKIIIDELKTKLNFKVDEQKLPELTAEELKSQVDNAIGEFVGPLKMKEQLVAQLKTQITDLERFIAFLQCDTDESKLKTLTTGGEKLSEAYNSYSAKKKKDSLKPKEPKAALVNDCRANPATSAATRESLHHKAHSLMDKASLLMQMFATTHFGAKPEEFQKNTLKKTNKGNHWGDLRAQLEVDIQEVASLAATLNFDREKLAKLRKSMKKAKSADVATSQPTTSASNGMLTTIPPRAARNGIKANYRNQLKPYQVSSDSDDDDYDMNDYYNWQQQNSRRMAHCARIRGDTINTLNKELTTAVRKNFAMTLLKLIQHGLRVESSPQMTSSLIVPFMRCLNPSPVFMAEHNFRARDCDAGSFLSSSSASSAAAFGYDDVEGMDTSGIWPDADNGGNGGIFSTGNTRPMHAWELILEYYYLKHGDEYNNTPARKLSQSFNLDIVNSQAVTSKQNLLSTVGTIIAMHRPYKRSYNAHFKAFVCAGLNSHQLVEWLNLIFSCNDLLDNYYMTNSYVACTGFRDALRSIDVLTKYDFDLPVDLAVRHFRNL
ncbi:RUN domain-containing protein 1 isoform X2 [Musca domestica]|uniref:RUN domain-containing protein 1 isoform X2 n=1 Tax=Musca domestica TaxID=7370 RepID=A0ABM3UTT4_MUSDO|nr:RUN domain-containing protein 1 isoform X2 [Musca domestica]